MFCFDSTHCAALRATKRLGAASNKFRARDELLEQMICTKDGPTEARVEQREDMEVSRYRITFM